MPFTQNEERELPSIISVPRFETYLNAANRNISLALSLYQWNLELSAAFIIPLQVCEVAARNGVVHALEQQYGNNWHISKGFMRSLPNTKKGYCPRSNFKSTSEILKKRQSLTSGKLVADLKFVFWENMLTRRHDQRLWNPYFRASFPFADVNTSVQLARRKANTHLERIRNLRNRIAHHEPIFSRDTVSDYDCVLDVIRWRSPVAADWVQKVQKVKNINAQKPIIRLNVPLNLDSE